MTSCQIDWLTLSCLSSKQVSLIDFLQTVLRCLFLEKIWDKFDNVGRDKYYAAVYRYNDISICLCRDTPEQMIKQGIGIKFSGNSLAFYQDYIKQEYNVDLRYACKRWRALSCNGFFTRCTRFDFAADDKAFNGDKPLLTVRRVRSSFERREFSSRLTTSRKTESSSLSVSSDVSSKCDETVGDTVYVGKRKGSIFCRFYDKLAEQQARKLPIEDNLTSWVRCEFEFHNARAMAVFNAFCDKDDDDDKDSDDNFQNYISGVINNYISFIYRTDSNVSRCPIKRWWAKFLDTVKKNRLVIPEYKPAKFSATQRWLNKSVFPTLAYYIKCVGFERFLKKLGEYVHKKPSKRVKEMISDFNTCKSKSFKAFASGSYDDYIKTIGVEPWVYTGAVSYDKLKADFVDYCDFSPDLSFDGEQLSLLCEGL